jgi:NADH-quinone oxidoreductase subunit M
LVQTFAHGINVVGLFYCADILYKRFKSRDIREMGGYAKVAPKFAIVLDHYIRFYGSSIN